MLRSAGQEWAGPTRRQEKGLGAAFEVGHSGELRTEELRPGCHRSSLPVCLAGQRSTCNIIQQSYSIVVAVVFSVSGCGVVWLQEANMSRQQRN